MDDFYYNQKVKSIEGKFNQVYNSASEMSLDEFIDQMYNLELTNGLMINLVPSDYFGVAVIGEVSTINPIFFYANSTNGEEFEVTLATNDFSVLNGASINDSIEVTGIVVENAIFAVEVNGNRLMDVDDEVKKVNLTIVTPPGLLNESVHTQVEKIDQRILDDLSYFTFESEYNKDLTIAFNREISFGGSKYQLYSEQSIQSVREISSVLLPFYIVFYIVGIIFAFILSQILSKRISKPIIEITKKSEAMTRLEFDQVIEYQRDDELGQLSNSINSLSANLQKSLMDLRASNNSLLSEIEKEKQNEADRKTFITNVSHELKTPLAISRGYLEAINDKLDENKQSEYLEIIYKENENMSNIVSSMLTLLKSESEQAYELVLYDVESILVELKDFFKLKLVEHNVELEIVGEFTSCYIDTLSFKSVMINLISNAIRYGTENSVIKIIGSISEKQSISIENQTVFDVDVDTIFERFYTSDSSRNKKTSGTGLGLAIVKSILSKYPSEFSASCVNNIFKFDFSLKIEDTEN
jgi:signal transduction histidine kinase